MFLRVTMASKFSICSLYCCTPAPLRSRICLASALIFSESFERLEFTTIMSWLLSFSTAGPNSLSRSTFCSVERRSYYDSSMRHLSSLLILCLAMNCSILVSVLWNLLMQSANCYNSLNSFFAQSYTSFVVLVWPFNTPSWTSIADSSLYNSRLVSL